MSIEEAVERLNAIKQFIGYDKDSEIVKATQKSLDMAIKALEQNESAEEWYKLFVEKLDQEPKTGHWHIAHGMYEDRFWCDCGFIKIIDNTMSDWKYCPKCGCRKVEPQESECEE